MAHTIEEYRQMDQEQWFRAHFMDDLEGGMLPTTDYIRIGGLTHITPEERRRAIAIVQKWIADLTNPKGHRLAFKKNCQKFLAELQAGLKG